MYDKQFKSQCNESSTMNRSVWITWEPVNINDFKGEECLFLTKIGGGGCAGGT